TQVRLEAHADAGVRRPRPAEQLERDVHVAGFLHVDPEKGGCVGRAGGERAHVLETRRAVHVEAQVRELDGNLGGEPALPHAVEHLQVVVADSGTLGAGRHLLAEPGEHAPDAVAGEPGCGVERGAELLARQEAAHGAAEEGPLGELAREPGAARGGEQQPAGESQAREGGGGGGGSSPPPPSSRLRRAAPRRPGAPRPSRTPGRSILPPAAGPAAGAGRSWRAPGPLPPRPRVARGETTTTRRGTTPATRAPRPRCRLASRTAPCR